MPALRVGDTAPDFALKDEHGAIVRLADYCGKQAVVLIFYPADFTGGCTRQLCAIRDNYARFVEAGAAVLGINPAPRLLHRAFAARHGYQFPLLADPFQRVARLYDVMQLGKPFLNRRTVYVVGQDGRIRFAERGMPGTAQILAAIEDRG